jgi:hypothetical protein
LFLSGCDSDPTRGIREGTQIVYGYKVLNGSDRVSGKTTPRWLAEKTKHTVTFRSDDGYDLVKPKSEVLWIEKAKRRKRMPGKKVR